MAKLTDAQRDVLARMEAGETLYRFTSFGPSPDRWRVGMTHVNGNTMRSLTKNAYVYSVAYHTGVSEYALTDAGRAALEQE